MERRRSREVRLGCSLEWAAAWLRRKELMRFELRSWVGKVGERWWTRRFMVQLAAGRRACCPANSRWLSQASAAWARGGTRWGVVGAAERRRCSFASTASRCAWRRSSWFGVAGRSLRRREARLLHALALSAGFTVVGPSILRRCRRMAYEVLKNRSPDWTAPSGPTTSSTGARGVWQFGSQSLFIFFVR